MKSLRNAHWVRDFELSERLIPFVFLMALILAFGIFIPQLGIYQDDWVFVYNAYARGPQGLAEFLNADGAPISSIMNIALFQTLGFKPLYWHISELIVRWLTVVAFWLLLQTLWHGNTQQNFWICILFAIYPFFTLQPLAFTYLHIWISFALLMYSMYWMILAVDRPARFWLYTSLALAGGILSLLTSEYFAGYELLRPLVLWFFFRGHTNQERLTRSLKGWLQYLPILLFYSIWRFFLYVPPIEGRNAPIVAEALLKHPLLGLRTIFSNLLPDLTTILVTSWFRIIDPANLDLTDRRNLLTFFLSVGTSIGFIWLLTHQKPDTPAEAPQNPIWRSEMFWLGLLTLILGVAPGYAGGYFINDKNPLWSSRFGLASMPGAALLVVVFLEKLFTDFRTRLIILAILIGFSIGYHARYTNEFRYVWKKEQNLFRQLTVRAPVIQENTALVAEGEILGYMGDYPTAYAINTIYSLPAHDRGNYARYWFFGITSNYFEQIDDFMGGMPIESYHRMINFEGRSDQSLIISFEPEKQQCLHVIRPEDASFRYLPSLLKRAAPLSALGRIQTAPSVQYPFLDAIGMNQPQDWCFFYQQADLARQTGDWQKVISLWNTAHKNGLNPNVYFENFLFLDAFIHEGKWDDAVKLSQDMRTTFPISRFPLCDYWNSLPSSPGRDSAFEELKPRLRCFDK